MCNSDGDLGDPDEVDFDMSKLLKELGSVFDPREISQMMSSELADEDTDGSSDIDLGNVTS